MVSTILPMCALDSIERVGLGGLRERQRPVDLRTHLPLRRAMATPRARAPTAMRAFSATGRGRSVEPVNVSRRAHDQRRVDGRLAALQDRDLHEAPVLGQQRQVARHVVAADHVEDHVHATTAGCVAQRPRRSPRRGSSRRASRRGPRRPRTWPPTRRSRTRSPRRATRAGSPSCRCRSSRRARAATRPPAARPRSNTLVQTVKKVSGNGGRLDHRQAGRPWQALAFGRDGVLGVPTARQQRTDLIAGAPPRRRPDRTRRPRRPPRGRAGPTRRGAARTPPLR